MSGEDAGRPAGEGSGEVGDAAVGEPELGGESACMAHLLCPECGAVLDGGPHRDGCALGDPALS